MERIGSSNPTAASLTTPVAPGVSSTAPESARVKDGGHAASAETGPYRSAAPTAGSADIPEPPAGPSDPGLGQEVLDRSFAEQEKLEKELKDIDPTTPEGSKRMAEVIRKLNHCDEMISMVREMRKDQHDMAMKSIEQI